MTIEELNDAVESGEIGETIRVAEARQQKTLSKIADDICGRSGVRLVLLAGASSAGKTTTAKRICTQLRVNGAEALLLSTDDYFVGDRRNPRDENGELDYEHVDCVDRPRLADDINALMRAETVHPRKFDFVAHEGFDADGEISLPKGGYIVLEGIHALNPLLTAGIADECKYRMFIEPKTQIEIFAMTSLKPEDGRFLRRMVRDNQFRKMSPFQTMALWPKVLEGEKKWINPFAKDVDATFDSGLNYELAVLKPYVAGLLEIVKMKNPADARINGLVELLGAIQPADPGLVPGDSILRETIGGSQLEY